MVGLTFYDPKNFNEIERLFKNIIRMYFPETIRTWAPPGHSNTGRPLRL